MADGSYVSRDDYPTERIHSGETTLPNLDNMTRPMETLKKEFTPSESENENVLDLQDTKIKETTKDMMNSMKSLSRMWRMRQTRLQMQDAQKAPVKIVQKLRPLNVANVPRGFIRNRI